MKDLCTENCKIFFEKSQRISKKKKKKKGEIHPVCGLEVFTLY